MSEPPEVNAARGVTGEIPEPSEGSPAKAGPLPAWVLLAVAALVLGAFGEGARIIGVHWFEPGSYYAHGPLVVLVCVWLVHRDRARLAAVPRGSTALGFALVILALWAHAVGALERVGTLPRYALVAGLLGCALVLFGACLVRATWFPWLYLTLFAIPMPKPLLRAATVDLKLAVARWTHAAVESLGHPAILRGDSIHFLGGRTVLVDDLCSGLRSLITLLALACLFAYLQRARWKAALILVLATPIALLANVIRTLALSLLAARGTPAEAGGLLHEATGLLIYAAALGLLFALQALPEGEEQADPQGAPPPDAPAAPASAPAAPASEPAAPAPAPAPAPASAPAVPASEPAAPRHRPVSRARVRGLLALLGIGCLGSGLLLLRAPPAAEPSHVTAGIPLDIGAWEGQDLPFNEAERSLLGGDALRRRYRRPGDQAAVEVFVLHARQAAVGIHGPHICYTLQGFVELNRSQALLPSGGGDLEANRTLISLGGQQHLVYYWFRLNGEPFTGYDGLRVAKLLHRAVGLRESEGSTIRLSTPLVGGEAASDARLRAFAQDALAEVLAPLP